MKKIIVFINVFLLVWPFGSLSAAGLADKLSGRILLQVEENGEAWYVAPFDKMRYFLGRPADAFALMREQGIGITDADLDKIPAGLIEETKFPVGNLVSDADGDGLPDDLETAIGTDKTRADTDGDGFDDKHELANGFNYLGSGVMPVNLDFTGRQPGKIFLAVERNGEAWYVNPADGKRYFLGRPADAFAIMRSLGLGITNGDLDKILAGTPGFLLSIGERDIHEAVNRERTGGGLPALRWNEELAAVAREHSLNLARENETFTAFGVACDFPLIHHEGLDFGIYNSERLSNRDVHYFSQTAENIALLSGATYKVVYWEGDPVGAKLAACQKKREDWDAAFKSVVDAGRDNEEKMAIVRAELLRRAAAFESETAIRASEVNWRAEDIIVSEMTKGWMESPGHRANIMNAAYDEAGVGLAYVNDFFIATQVFIKRADCGFKNGPCCEKAGYYPYCYLPLECRDSICGE
ncbi:MAG: CAP domain-containing protein [Candidatus Falkowbacteria bacterium]